MLTRLKLEKWLFFLVILFLPTQLGKHFWPDFSYIYSLKIDYLSPIIYFWDLLVLGLIIIWVFGRPKINQFALTLLLVVLLSQVISLFAATNILGGLVRFEQYLISGALALYISSQGFNKIKTAFFWGLSLAGVIQGIIALLEFILGRSLGLWVLGERNFSLSTPSIATFNFYGQTFLRPYGTFSHPNVLAGFMVVVLPILAAAPNNIFKGFSRALAVVSIVVSFSRASLIVLFLEIAFFVKNSSFLKHKLLWFALLLILLAPFLYVRFSSAFNFDNLSLVRREELAGVALKFFRSSPILGIGLNNFIDQTASSILISGESRFLQPVHNILLLTLSETGIVGVLGLLGFLLVPIKKLLTFKNSSFPQMLLISWGSILFLGMFDHYFLTLPQGYRLLFLVWGLSMVKYH